MTTEGEWWIYLSPIFPRQWTKLQKKYPDFQFRTKQEFGKFSLPNFSRLSSSALFLELSNFSRLMEKEKRTELLSIFHKELAVFRESIASVSESSLSHSLPMEGFIYVMEFPSLQLGKVGRTQNWKDRQKELRAEYDKEGQMIFHEICRDVGAVEAEVLAWLKKEGALRSTPTRKGGDSRETFCLNKMPVTKVQEFLQQQLALEKKARETMEGVNQIVLQKLHTDKKFLMEVLEMQTRVYYNQLFDRLSPEQLEKLASQKLSENNLPNVFDIPLSKPKEND